MLISIDYDKLCIYNVTSRATTKNDTQKDILKNSLDKSKWINQNGILKNVQVTQEGRIKKAEK